MNNGSFDALTRRASIVTLGAAGLAATLGGSFTADAKKKGGKNKKKKTCTNPCPAQVASCTTALTNICAGDPGCQDSIACCSSLGTCDVSGFLACVIASSQEM